MTDKQVEEFKAELRRYKRLIGLQAQLKERLNLMLYDLTGVKAIAYDKVKGTLNQQAIEYTKLQMLDEYEDILMTYNLISQRVKTIQNVLNQMKSEDRVMFMMKYLDGMSFYSLAKLNYMSKSGLIYYMNNVLKGLKL